MNIVLLGATGKTGTELLNQALEAGHTVTAVVRTPTKLNSANPALTVIQGDVMNADSLASAMHGKDALLTTLGANNPTLITDSTKAIIAAANRAGLKRVMMMSSFLVEQEKLQGLAKLLTSLIIKKQITDKSAGEALLRRSSLDWTIVHATVLTKGDKATGAKLAPANEKLGMKHKVSRAAVAAWMLNALDNNEYIKQDVTITG